MSFVYEMVGEENRKLWESIGWKNWFAKSLIFNKKGYWSYDLQREIYLVEIGRYIETPRYWDMCYWGRIIRMEIGVDTKGDLDVGVSFLWKVNNIYIPKAIWMEKENILNAVQEAFSVVRNLVPEDKVIEINVEIMCEPKCVEADYNGR